MARGFRPGLPSSDERSSHFASGGASLSVAILHRKIIRDAPRRECFANASTNEGLTVETPFWFETLIG
jgi:hypothetical protein